MAKEKPVRRCKVTGNILVPKNKGGAPMGNQNAIGNQGGRPSEYDKVAIAERMLEWAKQDDSININKFCAYNDIPARTFLEWVDDDIEFSRAYDKVKTFLGFRREERLNSGELHVKAFDLNATVYDQFNRAEKISMDDMAAARKLKEVETAANIHDLMSAKADELEQK
jgi:hypothetical protein